MTLHTKREQAASWYDARAKRAGDFGRTYARQADEIRAAEIRKGEFDHRLDRMIAEQVEYDGDGA